MTEYTYAQWKTELNNKKTAIDELEEAHWTKIFDDETITKEEASKLSIEFATERQKLVDALEDHYGIEPNH